MTLRVKAGVTLNPGDLVALNEQGEVIKAGKVYDPIGVVMGDPSGGYVIRAIEKGYVTNTIARWDPKKDPDPIVDVLRAMNNDPHLNAVIQSRVNSAAGLREEANRKVRIEASRVLGTALHDAVVGEMAKVLLGSSNVPTLNFPPPPPIPMPSLPSIPTFSLPLDEPKEIKVVFDKDGKRPFWLGLLRQDGKEVQSPEYDRQMVELDIRGSSVGTKFPTALSDWGIITHIAMYETPDASTPLLTFPTTVPTSVSPGTTMNLANIQITTSPAGLAPSPRLHLGPPKVAED